MNLPKRHFASIALLSLTLSVSVGDAFADQGRASADWLAEDYPYLVVDQALPDVLRELGHNLDIAVDVSPKIKGRLTHYVHDGSAGELMEHLVAEHRLDWVFDDGRLYFSSADEQIARSWSGNADVFESAKSALANSGIDDPRYQVRFDSGRGEISLSAPPRFLALAAPVIDRALAPKATRTVNVIHGRARAGGT